MRKSELFDAYLSESLSPEQTEELKKILATENGSKEFMHYMTESHLMCDILEKKEEQKQTKTIETRKNKPVIPIIIAIAASVVLFLLIKTPIEEPSSVTIIEKGHKKEVLLSDKKTYKTSEVKSLTLSDGSTINSRGQGLLTVENKNNVKVENGLFSFAVKPRNEKNRFRIEMTHGTIEVIGTAFDIIDSPELSSIKVTEGVVSFIHGKELLILKAGDSASASESSLVKTEVNIAENLELLIDGEYTDDKRAFRDISGKTRTGWASWNKGDDGAVKQVLEANNHAIEFTKSGRLGIDKFILNGPFTLSCWIKPNGTIKEFQSMLSNGDSSWQLNLGPNSLTPYLSVAGLTRSVVRANTSLEVQKWQLVSGVYTGESLKIYINGIFNKETVVTGQIQQYKGNIEVGGNHEAQGRNFEGALDGVQVHSRALSDLEILQLFKAGRP